MISTEVPWGGGGGAMGRRGRCHGEEGEVPWGGGGGAMGRRGRCHGEEEVP